MLMEVKNQIKVTFLSIRYNLMREMSNRVTFLMNVIFMMLNNATFIIQWIVLFSFKSDFNGYQMKDVMILWAIAASSYGIAHIMFGKAFSLSDAIMKGQLDAFLVQPKNVLISVITSETTISSIGDLLYGVIVVLIVAKEKIIVYLLYSIVSAIALTALAIVCGSLAFWLKRSDLIADYINSCMIHFSTYPADGIFKGVAKLILYTIVPVGIINYMPVHLIIKFDAMELIYLLSFTVGIVLLALLVFYRGLRCYSSSNLMESRS